MVKKKSSSRLLENLRKVLVQYINGKRFAALSEQDLMNRLAVPPQHTPLFRSLLQELVDTGILLQNAENLYVQPQSIEERIQGILHTHARGFGFVVPDDRKRFPQDIFIPKHLTQTAVDGDLVEIVITGPGLADKGPEGKVIAIVTRSRTHLAGTVRLLQSPTEAIVYVPTLGNTHTVYAEHEASQPLNIGDRIVMEVLEWGEGKDSTRTRFSHIIGSLSDATRDVAAAIELFQLRANFDLETIQESIRFGNRVPLASLKGREDLRGLTCFTIDPDTAKDFDDALSLTEDENGIFHLGVHIADVSYYVKPGSAIDREASLRCNSTYFPGTCLPMLPSVLSENLCSLKEKVNRLTVSVLIRYSPEGLLLDYRIVRSVIRSSKRFTYREAKAVLDGVKKSPHLETLERMTRLCGILKQQRQSRGSIEFSIPELSLEIDPITGMPSGTTLIAYDITHQMVEEYMLKANELVALHLAQQGHHLSYRVHEEPAEESQREFVQLARYFGFPLHDNPTSEDLQELFRQAETTPYASHLATSFIRSMRLALYSGDNIGHYGLQLTHYCHFTSPIRRYVDLVIHRSLFGDKHAEEKIALISKQCSDQERLSAKAENYVRTLKKLRILDQQLQTEDDREYAAIVTRIKPFGLFFEITSLFLEGFLHISALGSDYFIFDQLHNQLRGRHTGQIFRCTDPITVILERVDLIMLEATWSIATPSVEDEVALLERPSSYKASKPHKKKRAFKSNRSTPENEERAPQAQTSAPATSNAPYAPRKKSYAKRASSPIKSEKQFKGEKQAKWEKQESKYPVKAKPPVKKSAKKGAFSIKTDKAPLEQSHKPGARKAPKRPSKAPSKKH